MAQAVMVGLVVAAELGVRELLVKEIPEVYNPSLEITAVVVAVEQVRLDPMEQVQTAARGVQD
jgi:hypothetical protein